MNDEHDKLGPTIDTRDRHVRALQADNDRLRAELAERDTSPRAAVPDEAIATIWQAAMTAACNVLIGRQNKLNANDGPDDILHEQSACIEEMRGWLEIDDVFLQEVRAMLSAVPPQPEANHE